MLIIKITVTAAEGITPVAGVVIVIIITTETAIMIMKQKITETIMIVLAEEVHGAEELRGAGETMMMTEGVQVVMTAIAPVVVPVIPIVSAEEVLPVEEQVAVGNIVGTSGLM